MQTDMFYRAEPVPGQRRPNPKVQEALRLGYGTLIPMIRFTLDPFVHDLAEQAIHEFFPHQRPSDALEDYIADLESSEALTEMAKGIAPIPGTEADMELIMRTLLTVTRKTFAAHRETMANAGRNGYPDALREALQVK